MVVAQTILLDQYAVSFTLEQCALFESYIESKSRADFSDSFPDASVPKRSAVFRIITHFSDAGSVHDPKRIAQQYQEINAVHSFTISIGITEHDCWLHEAVMYRYAMIA